jgi:hypothetical protein
MEAQPRQEVKIPVSFRRDQIKNELLAKLMADDF